MTPLARLSFWIPPDQTASFERAYLTLVLPFLHECGWQEAGLPQRPAPAGICSHLFAVETPQQAPAMEAQLRRDPRWQEAVAGLGRMLGQPPRWSFHLFSTPTGAGRLSEAGSGQRQGLWFILGVQDRLPSAVVTCLFQDSRGRLWGGTYGKGAWCYDGAYIRSFGLEEGLPSDKVYTIAEDREGRVWLGTENCGLCRWDGHTIEVFDAADGLTSECIDGILADRQGRLWVWKQGGALSCITSECCRPFADAQGQPLEQVTCLREDRQGRIWFGTQDRGVGCLESTLRCFTQAEGLVSNWIYCLLEDHQGRVWAGTQGGLCRWDGIAWRTLTTDGPVASLGQDPQGRLWFGTHKGKIHLCDGERLELVPPPSPAPDFGAAAIQADRQGRMWFFGGYDGACCFDGQHFQVFTTAEGLGHNHVKSFLEDREGNLWFGSWGGGVNRFDGTCLRHYTPAQGLSNARVEALLEDREGNLWFGTWGGGASCWDGRQFKTFTTAEGLAGDELWSLCQDRQGRVWLGTYSGGASSWDGERFTYLTTAEGLGHNSVWCIFQDSQDRLWFGTQGGGASCWDGEGFTHLTTAEGLPDNRVWAIAEDASGAFWFSTFEGGVCRWDGHHLEHFTTAEGLAHNQVWCILRDRQGYLWFGTWGGGASRFDGQVFQTLSRKDGLIHDAVQEVLQDHQGRYWIATEAGVTCYTPPRTPPAIHLRDVIAHQRHGAVQQLNIPAAQPFVLFEFQGSGLLTRPSQFAYVYRLLGHQDEWRTTYQRRVEFNHLPVGTYTFEVRAVDRDLNYSETLSVQLTVEPDQQQDRIQALKKELSRPQGLEQFIGQSAALKTVLEQIHAVARAEVTTLILGETGTGKGLVAGALHSLGPRRSQPFIHINCGAIPEGLIESELFGHEKGAFTGAAARKLGRFELADGGTLFLDEIGDLPPDSQRVLLQVLQDGTFQRVGGQQNLKVDVRVIAATNRDLRRAMQQGQFREDLFFRLNTFVLSLPPLRERREDVPLLMYYFAEQFAHHLHRPAPHIAPQVLESLSRYGWPGNVRELEHLVQRALLVCRGTRSSRRISSSGPPPPPLPLRRARPPPVPWTSSNARPRSRNGS